MIYNWKKRVLALVFVLALVLLAGCGTTAAPSRVSLEPAAEEQTSVSDDGRPVVRVSTVDEFLSAIADDTVIELEAGTYNLPSAADYGGTADSSRYYWEDAYDGFQLTVEGVSNLSVRGAGMEETVLSTEPRYANVIRFSNCSGIEVSRLTAGHTREPGFCSGGVLSFDNCEDCTVDGCGLYGCGTTGVWAGYSSKITVKNSSIYECSYSAVSLSSCRDVLVTACDIYGHGTRLDLGSAFNLFDAYHADGFIICQNRIHDNNARYLLNLDATKGAVFLSNEVTGNRLENAYFAFQQYSATVDGCEFSGNECPGGWYSGEHGNIFASDAEGKLLDPDALENMAYEDIDIASVVPAKSPAAPTEVAAGGKIVVSTVDDFLNAIGPDRIIVLDGELFDLASAASYGSLGGEYWYWQECYDGPELVIENVSGLSIFSSAEDAKDTALSAAPRYANVLSFRNCENISLAGFTAGHTKEPGSCAGGVLYFDNCHGVKMEKMRLYGCGVLGIQASGCSSLALLRTEIYECSQGAGRFNLTDGITFNGCDIHDVPSPALSFVECGDKTWNGEPVNGLYGDYDVGADGSLTEYTWSDYGYEGDWIGGDAFAGDNQGISSSFADLVPFSFSENPAALAFAGTVQQLIADGDWEGLADRVSYPLTILGDGIHYSISGREAFLTEDIGGILTEEFRARVAAAPLEQYGQSLFGNSFCDGYLAFSCWGNANDADAYRVSCISTAIPLS